jgi:hypothetical protein
MYTFHKLQIVVLLILRIYHMHLQVNAKYTFFPENAKDLCISFHWKDRGIYKSPTRWVTVFKHRQSILLTVGNLPLSLGGSSSYVVRSSNVLQAYPSTLVSIAIFQWWIGVNFTIYKGTIGICTRCWSSDSFCVEYQSKGSQILPIIEHTGGNMHSKSSELKQVAKCKWMW